MPNGEQRQLSCAHVLADARPRQGRGPRRDRSAGSSWSGLWSSGRVESSQVEVIMAAVPQSQAVGGRCADGRSLVRGCRARQVLMGYSACLSTARVLLMAQGSMMKMVREVF